MKRLKYQFVSRILIVTAFFWLGLLMCREKTSIFELFSQFKFYDMRFVGASILLGALAVGTQLFLYRNTLYAITDKRYSLVFLAKVFFLGQIVRYLPGRLFGILYQVNETLQEIPPATIFRANVDLMLMLIYFHALSSAVVMLWYFNYLLLAGIVLFLGLLAFKVLCFAKFIDAVIMFFCRIFPKKITNKIPLGSFTHNFRPFLVWQNMAVFIVFYFIYFMAWMVLSNVFKQYSPREMILLCAVYNVSWVIGFVSMITPGGLGFREVSFVLISSRVAPHFQTSLLAIFFRFWLLFIDILVVLLAVIVDNMKSVRLKGPCS